MRFVLFTLGLGLVLTACGRTEFDPPISGCGEGLDSCGIYCVPAGTCKQSSGGNQAGTTGASGGVISLGTATGTSSFQPSTKCTDMASLQRSLTAQYDGTFLTVTGSSKTYYVMTNWWSRYEAQTVTVDGLSYTLGNSTNARSSNNNPMGYPTFYIGSYSGHTTTGSNLPKQVSALTKVPTFMATNAKSKGVSDYNAAYDVWFTSSSSPLGSSQYSPGAGGAYLMVWLFMPSDRQPRGQISANAQKVAGLPGTWNVWVDSSNPPCISYVSATPVESLDFDLNDVIKDAVTNKYGITASMYLSVVFGGFEVWGGGDGLQLKAFCASVE